MDKAVILARGLGTRMQKTNDCASLTEAQAAVAETGVKALIPIDRPFLDYVLTKLADAAFRRICLVIGPEHDELKNYYNSLNCTRVNIEFAIQHEPLGTADAVLAAENFAEGQEFVVVNSDNYYPAKALNQLRRLQGCGLIGFDRDGMLQGSNIEPERIEGFAVINVDDEGYMRRIIEKPDAKLLASMPEPICLSMNCWRFNSAIFDACRSIEPSSRGELELPHAVQYAIESLNQLFKVIPSSEPVLDLSSRKDIGPVTEKLAGQEVHL